MNVRSPIQPPPVEPTVEIAKLAWSQYLELACIGRRLAYLVALAIVQTLLLGILVLRSLAYVPSN